MTSIRSFAADSFGKLKQARSHTWILVVLILVGIFFRIYHFQELLVFASDQARDLKIVSDVVNDNASWPLLGPDMTGGRGFRLGAIYYSFQIVSAKLFGVGPTQQAYPDVLFSILSIPLLYRFLRRYFDEKVSLLSTSVFVFSYFSIEYSRFAWNVNLIPFFVLLYLHSLVGFLEEKGKASWKWIVGIGIALGVGVQLHAILLLLLPAMSAIVFAFILFLDKRTWRKCAVVVLIALSLNTGQFISEQKTGLANTKTFFSAFLFKSERTGGSFVKGVKLDLACNAQANVHILSSLGNKNICNILYDPLVISPTYKTPIVFQTDPLSIAGLVALLSFSVLGYGFLIYRLLTANESGKQAWGLVLLYGILYFLVMIPIAPGSRMRYYLPIAFMPFIFLSFVLEWLTRRFPKRYAWVAGAIIALLFVSNMNSVRQKLENTECDKATRADIGCSIPIR